MEGGADVFQSPHLLMERVEESLTLWRGVESALSSIGRREWETCLEDGISALIRSLRFLRKGRLDRGAGWYINARRLLDGVDLAGTAEDLLRRVEEGHPLSPSHASMEPLLKGALWDLYLGRSGSGMRRIIEACRGLKGARPCPDAPGDRKGGAGPPSGPFPFVSFAPHFDRAMEELGFEVAHIFLKWFQDGPSAGFDHTLNDLLMEGGRRAGASFILLPDLSPPAWWRERYEGMVPLPPSLLGRVQEGMKHYRRFMEEMVQRYRDDKVLAWTVRNEPSYISFGIVKGEMEEAFRRFMEMKYKEIGRLNEAWRTGFPSFSELKPPGAPSSPGWYDLVLFKAQCLASEAGSEADFLHSRGVRVPVGVKVPSGSLSAHSARLGLGIDPFLLDSESFDISMKDIYTDSLEESLLRVAESSSSGKPLIVMEYGRLSVPGGRVHRYFPHPDEMGRLIPWMLFGFGASGVNFWAWVGGEEASSMNWDGSIPDFVLSAAMANAEMRTLRDELSGISPHYDGYYYYPRATFIRGGPEYATLYENIFHTLSSAGYQLKIVPAGFKGLDPRHAPFILIPPSPWIEREFMETLHDYVRRGGEVVLSGDPPEFSGMGEPLPAGLSRGFKRISGDFGKEFPQGVIAIPLHGEWRFSFSDSWEEGDGRMPEYYPVERGLEEGWHLPSFDDSAWEGVKVPEVWEERHPGKNGFGWYRRSFTLPSPPSGERFLLIGKGIDDRGEVFLNGERLLYTETWGEGFEKDVTGVIRGGENTIAVRVYDSWLYGGIRGFLEIVSSGRERGEGKLLEEGLSSLGFPPSSRGGLPYRRVLNGGKGEVSLLVVHGGEERFEGLLHIRRDLLEDDGEKGYCRELLSMRRIRWRERGGYIEVKVAIPPLTPLMLRF